MSLWSGESAAYNVMTTEIGRPYLSKSQRLRFERLRQARMLYDGRHREYFFAEGRTQFNFREMSVQGRFVANYVTCNVLRLMTHKSADLLFGEPPAVHAENAQQQASLDSLAERSNLHHVLYVAAINASWANEAFLESVIRDGQVYVCGVGSDAIFPIGEPGPDGQYLAYVRYDEADLGTDDQPERIVLETTYEPGVIRRRLRALSASGEAGEALPLDRWPVGGEQLAGRGEEERTGIDDNTITYLPNDMSGGTASGDYDGLIGMQDALNAKSTQVANVLAKHADPKLAAPAHVADPESGNLPAEADVYFFQDGQQLPQYIVWKAELEAAMEDRRYTLNAMCMAGETSQVLLGLKEGAAPDAARKLRLEATNSLAKAARKAAVMRPGIVRALTVAQDLEQLLPGVRYDREPLSVEIRDGLPLDGIDKAEEISIYRSAGIMSRRRSVALQLEDAEAVEKELAELQREDEANMPSILLGGEDREEASDAG